MTNLLLITIRSDVGGGPKHVDQLISNLSNRYHIFVASPFESPYGIKWEAQLQSSNFFELPHRRFDIIKFFLLIKWIKKNTITIIHSHGKGAGIYSRLIKVFMPSIKIIHTFHGINKHPNPLRNFIFIGIEKLLTKLTEKCIFVSYGELTKANNLGLHFGNKSSVIYNGITDPCVINLRKKEESFFQITSISRFDYAKNMDVAFEIAKHFKESRKIKFIWIGDGEDKERLQEKSKEEGLNIEFTGFIDPFPLLCTADILLSTSRFEGLPYALIEACSMGIPIIATDVTGNNEVVENGYNGLLFNSISEATDQIDKLFTEPKLKLSLGLNARTRFLEYFTIDKMIYELNLVYESIETM
jgi:Glycosyltransferase